jgi:hypothetical protein
LLLRVVCPHCQKPCQLDQQAVNGPVTCPDCGCRFAVRRPQTAPPVAAAVPGPVAESPPESGPRNGPALLPAAAEPAPVGRDNQESSPGLLPHPASPPPAPAVNSWEIQEGGEQARPVTLEGGPLGFIDRLLPSRPRWFLLVVFGIVSSCWLLGFLLVGNRAVFLAAKEWQAVPVYLAAHFITLRLFVSLYAGNFLRGCKYMDMPTGEAVLSMRRVLGPLGGLVALLVAAPFIIKDYLYVIGDDYRNPLGPPLGSVGVVDFLLWGTWAVEWIINAYIWVLQLGFLALTMRTLRRHTFRDPVEIVLHEKHYRPFLLMSGQGASIVFGFGIVTGVYIWYTGGEIQDYLGLIITAVLLLVGFGPPWLLLKSRVEKVVNGEKYRLRDRLIAAARRRATAGDKADGGTPAPTAVQELTARLDEALSMLRIDYLDRLQRELGQNEARNMLLKLLAPAATVLWKVVRTFVFPG